MGQEEYMPPYGKENYEKIKEEAKRQLDSRGYILMSELLNAKATTRQNIQQVIMPKLERDFKLERVNKHAWRVIGSGVEVPDSSEIRKFLVKRPQTDDFIDDVREFALAVGDFGKIDVQRAIPKMSTQKVTKVISELLASGEVLYAEARRNPEVESTRFIHSSNWHRSIAGRIPKDDDNTQTAQIRRLLLQYKENGSEFYGLNVADLLSVNSGLVNNEIGRTLDCGEIELVRTERPGMRGSPRNIYRFKRNLNGEPHGRS
jgi:hypothetical protein